MSSELSDIEKHVQISKVDQEIEELQRKLRNLKMANAMRKLMMHKPRSDAEKADHARLLVQCLEGMFTLAGIDARREEQKKEDEKPNEKTDE